MNTSPSTSGYAHVNLSFRLVYDFLAFAKQSHVGYIRLNPVNYLHFDWQIVESYLHRLRCTRWYLLTDIYDLFIVKNSFLNINTCHIQLLCLLYHSNQTVSCNIKFVCKKLKI